VLIYIDIDETICNTSGPKNKPRDYRKAIPILENIQKANRLYDEGHTIVYWTARGSKTGTVWFNETHRQLTKWGVKFHEIKMGKPAYDLFICDKVMNTSDWQSKESNV